MRSYTGNCHIDFALLRTDLQPHLERIVRDLLPGGHREGQEWVALNPTRHDRNKGSFRINIKSGRWGDFATDDKGGDVISLYAYLNGSSQTEAARQLIKLMGLHHV